MSPSVEILQGTLDLLILKTLALEPMHGWGIAQRIQQVSRDILQIQQGSLYPALYRLERKKWIRAEWGASENNRRAKFYTLTKTGREQLERELADWKQMSTVSALILQRGQEARAMNLWRRWISRKKMWDQNMEDELRSHIERQTAVNIAAGLPLEEARRQAVLQLGALEGVKENCREERRGFWLESFYVDVRYALRILSKNPGFTIIAILTLALGIGANAAIFSVVQGVLLAPLPYSEPDRLVLVWQYNLTLKHPISVSYPDFLDWQRDARSLQQMAAFDSQDRNLTAPGTPEHLNGEEISSGFLSTLGIKPILGREFSPEEDKQGAAPVVLISDRLWRNRFAGSIEALGKSVTLDGVDYTVAGVLPASFRVFGDDAEVYTPIGQGDPLIYGDRTVHPILCVARLKSGTTIAQSEAEIGAIQAHLDQLYPSADRGLGASVRPLKHEFVADVSATLLLLLGAVGIVLLIACANVANLLLARSAARTREFAIRTALGASGARIVRQLLAESVLLSLAGGTLGLLLAKWGVRPVLATLPGSLPRTENIGVNVPVLLFALVVSVAVGILFGLAPALQSSRADLQASLKSRGRGSTSPHHRAQSSLVIVQMALTLVFLVC